MPSAIPLGPQDLQTTQREMSDYYRVPTISTRQDDIDIPLFFWRSDLFLRTNSSLFAYMSCTSLWCWAKAPSSLD
jgi:hypothetical protein